jgi:predicted signal transduction protein with EAL and GGDEF domain
MTLLAVALIASAYLYMGHVTYANTLFTAQTFTTLMAKFSPFLLVTLERADIALYKSKQSGRDKVTYYDRALENIAVYA